jgi:hypothetical protein
MKILIFFSRIALICNICFILAESMRYNEGLRLNAVFSTIVILGYVSLFLNLLLAFAATVVFILKKPMFRMFPRWLIITNFLFLIVQLFIFPA